MRYAMLICGVEGEWEGSAEPRSAEPRSAEPRSAGADPMAEVWGWFQRWEAAGKIAESGVELDSVRQAKTIRAGAGGEPVVTDGPYLELTEAVGGVIILSADDIDEAVAIAATWPIRGSTSVEVRPVIEH